MSEAFSVWPQPFTILTKFPLDRGCRSGRCAGGASGHQQCSRCDHHGEQPHGHSLVRVRGRHHGLSIHGRRCRYRGWFHSLPKRARLRGRHACDANDRRVGSQRDPRA